MKYQIGDKILVLLTDEEGKIVDIMNEKMVMIEVGGVTYPVYMDQIDFPYYKMFTKKKEIPRQKIYLDNIPEEKGPGKSKVATGVYLSFLPVFEKDIFDDPVVEKMKLHLINQTNTAFSFTYNYLIGGEIGFQLKNTIEPLADFYLHDIAFEEMSDNPKFDFEFSLVKADKKKEPYYECNLKIKARQLFIKIEALKEKNEPSFSYMLFETYPDKVLETKVDLSKLGNAGFKIYEASKAKQHMEQAHHIIDLHIEKLTTNWKQMNNHDILALQLKTFEKYYELSLIHHEPSLMVIHGIGEGRLKEEIHAFLKTKREVKSFVNQYHTRYGFGATEIWFEY
jgi:Smr domain